MRNNLVKRASLLLVLFTNAALAQTFENRPVTSETRVRDLGDMSKANEKYTISVINGQQVLGTPFLFFKWLNGSITTKDGRVFNDYELRYDALNQSVYFKNGGDSLEVQDEISDFTLIDSIYTHKFANVSQLKGGKKAVYYEELVTDAPGTLYKENKKRVSDENFGLPSNQIRKHFKTEENYYYYNKKTGKLDRIILSNPNISKILNLNESQQQSLNLRSYNFLNEDELTKFFTKYFEDQKLHG